MTDVHKILTDLYLALSELNLATDLLKHVLVQCERHTAPNALADVLIDLSGIRLDLTTAIDLHADHATVAQTDTADTADPLWMIHGSADSPPHRACAPGCAAGNTSPPCAEARADVDTRPNEVPK